LCAGGDICDKPIIAAVNGICLGGRVRDLGLVAEVVPEGEALPAAKKLAGRILRCAPLAIRATSQCVLGGLRHAGVPAASQSQEEGAFRALQAMMLSEDIREGLNAFPEKRRLEYKRR
jgi:crotonobetainyl-CoA hydratase